MAEQKWQQKLVMPDIDTSLTSKIGLHSIFCWSELVTLAQIIKRQANLSYHACIDKSREQTVPTIALQQHHLAAALTSNTYSL
jgi:hypothetical protein